MERHREREPRIPRAAHHRPRHARSDRIGLRGRARPTSPVSAARSGPRRTPPPCPPARPVSQVGPETSLTYEGGLHFRRARSAVEPVGLRERDSRQHREADAHPSAGRGRRRRSAARRSRQQTANGAVFVAAATNPVLVRVNFDNARIVGVEHTFDWRPSPHWCGRHDVHLPATRRTRRRTFRRTSRAGRPRPKATCASTTRRRADAGGPARTCTPPRAQTRLSTLDLDDRRTGATRTRSSIRSFFLNGATARGWVGAGRGRRGRHRRRRAARHRRDARPDSGPRARRRASTRRRSSGSVAGFVTVGLRGGIRLGAPRSHRRCRESRRSQLSRHQLGHGRAGTKHVDPVRRPILIGPLKQSSTTEAALLVIESDISGG